MASCRSDLLTPGQRRVLDVLRDEQNEFFLTGGAALGPFHLHHRTSVDLDLFTASEEAFRDSAAWADRLARHLGARLTTERVSPYFRRVVLETPGEGLRVEFVWDVPPQIVAEKPLIEGIRVDSLEDLVCNKIGALVGRSEVRDLIDLYFLAQAGFRPQDWWRRAQVKEGGLTPEILANQVSLVQLEAPWPHLVRPLTREELLRFRDELARDVARQAFPG